MKRIMKWLLAVLFVIVIFSVVIFQAITINNITQTQEDHFYAHIVAAVNSLEEYQETGYKFMYEDGLMELHSASSIALLLDDVSEYKGVHGVLLSIVGTYHSFPDDLALYIDEIIEILKDYSNHHNVENLYIKLKNIDNQLTAMMAERAEKVE